MSFTPQYSQLISISYETSYVDFIMFNKVKQEKQEKHVKLQQLGKFYVSLHETSSKNILQSQTRVNAVHLARFM